MEAWHSTFPRRNGYRLVQTYVCAVGTEGHETPAGVFSVLAKIRNPSWTMPDADWVPKEMRGTVVPGGDPANPLVGSFIKITDDPTGSVGIHGTRALDSLGTKASHGCIRVHPDVALELHKRIPTGTPVVLR